MDSNVSHKSTDYQSNNSNKSMSGEHLHEENKANFTKIMQDRWTRANAVLPLLDNKDISEEHPRFNNGKKFSPEHQHHPEYT